jgi:predicted ester cyclase
MSDLRDLYRRYIGRCNEHDFPRLGEFVAEDVNGPEEGLARYVAGLEDVVAAFPDYRWDVQDLLVDGDRLAVRITASGTHRGAFRDVAATGRRITTQELVIYRVEDDRIRQVWGDLGAVVRDELVSGGR